jgi:mono/diheme cytochrome c family protein/thiol-disulfide isomerase/thioredoxin
MRFPPATPPRGFGIRLATLALVLWAGSSSPGGDNPAPPARFLSALDLQGRAHHLTGGEADRAVALVFITTECPIAREYVPELNRLASQFAERPAKFFGVISDASISRAEAARFAQEFRIEFPVLFDASGEWKAVLAPTRVPEAFVLDAGGQIVYRGRIDDRYREVGKKRNAVTTHDLADALTAVLDGRAPENARTEPVGCPLPAVPARGATAPVTYNRDVAPILYANCAECHRPGEVAPFSLLTYDDAAKRAEHLAEVTSARLMPPWKAEIGYGHFLGERRLTDQQIELISAWAKAGAPEGDPADRPPQPEFASGWRLGQPDLVLQAPTPFTVPAGGPDIFQHFIIPLDIPEDKTVVGFEFRPGNPAVVHHAILFLDSTGMGRRKDEETPEPGYTTSGSIGIPTGGLIGVWTPGNTPRFFPQGMGMPLRKGTDIVLQLHLHPSGKEETDQSSIALYFADQPVERTLASTPFVIGTLLIDIPPGSADHAVSASVTLPCEVTLISLLPHMHLIGKEMELTATLPDGSLEHLIWIKDWNFYWQDNYVYREPVRLPKGTRIDVVSRYNNSADNPLNPTKPPRRVLFGNESTDEMCFALFQVASGRPEEDRKLRGALIQSFMKQWNDSSIDAEARATILKEAEKLFGARPTAFLDPLFGRGRRPAGG